MLKSSKPQAATASPKRGRAVPKKEEKNVIFGAQLFDAAISTDLRHGLIPAPVAKAVEFLDIVGLDTVGLYRVPPSTIKVKQYREAFNNGTEVDFFKAREDPHNVAGVVKAFLGELPEPLFTSKLLQAFKNLGEITDKDLLHTSMSKLLFQIPPSNRETIGSLARHLKNVADNSNVNKMTASNLATSIGPQYAVALAVMIEEAEFIPSTIVFGVPLQIAAVRSDPLGLVPSPVRVCIDFLEKGTKESSRLDTTQLYKEMSFPSVAQIYKFDAGVERLFGQFTDPVSVSNVLKVYIASLPETIFTVGLESNFLLTVQGGKDIENSLHDLAQKMPQCNYETLKSLIKHFVRVLQHSNKNQLTASSLGERWGGVWITLLPALVEHFDTIFKDGQEIDSGPWSHPLSGEKEAPGGTINLRSGKVRSMVLEFLAERWGEVERRPFCPLGKDCNNTDPTHFIKLQHT